MQTTLHQSRVIKSHRAGLACACATGFAFSANYTNHAPMAATLASEFHFSMALAGLLTTGVFLTHGAMQIPGGHLADRVGSTRVAVASLAIVSLGNFAIAFATAYWQLLFCKIFIGIGTGASFMAGARFIISAFAGPRLAFAQGFYGGSIALGAGFVIFAVPRLMAAVGWRGAFFSTAAIACAAAIAWTLADPLPPKATHPAGSFGGLLSNAQLWFLGVLQMASFGLAIVVSAWVTTYLRVALGIPLTRAGLIGSVILLLGIVMRPLGGMLVPLLGVRRI